MKICISIILVLTWTFCVFGQSYEGTFQKIRLTNVGSILIPSTMELQSGTYKELSDTFSKEQMKKIGAEVSGDSIIFQQKGLNDFKKVNTYARVMVKTTVGKVRDYRKATAKIVLTKKQLAGLDKQAKIELEDDFKAVGVGLKLIKWGGVSIDTVNGRNVLKTTYSRQLNDNPSVYVELYYIENNDRVHVFTISYREEDVSIWKEDLETTKNSFVLTNIK